MISFRDYLAEEFDSTHIDLYGRCNQAKLNAILKFDYKNTQHIHFYDYDDGIYSFTNLETAKENPQYGKYILKFRIPGGVKNFFFTSLDEYRKAVNKNAKDGIYADEVPFIDEQLKNFGLDKQKLLQRNIYPAGKYNKKGKEKYKERNGFRGVEDFQRFCIFLEENGFIPNNIKGIEYYSKNDKECFLVFDNKAIVPLEIYETETTWNREARDFITTIKSIKRIDKEIKVQGYKNSRNNLSVEKIQKNFLKKHELYLSSSNRAYFKNKKDYYSTIFPETLNGELFVYNMKLDRIIKAPKVVTGNCTYSYADLISLKGAPEKVGGKFSCTHNKLASLEGGPKEVGGDYDCYFNNLTSLKGAPEKVGGEFSCFNNPDIPLEEILEYSKAHPDTVVRSSHGHYKNGERI